MDEQKNGTPAPRRRRRADAQRTVISEDYTDSFQPEEAKPQEEARQPRRAACSVRSGKMNTMILTTSRATKRAERSAGRATKRDA